MAYDEGLAQLLRDELGETDDITERKMFGGLCFMFRGNMVCGVISDGAMFRVGKEREETALAIDGVGPNMFTGRPMAGMVETDGEVVADDERRQRLVALSMENAASLPPK